MPATRVKKRKKKYDSRMGSGTTPVTFSVPVDVREEMVKYRFMNWSSVVTTAIKDMCNRLSTSPNPPLS